MLSRRLRGEEGTTLAELVVCMCLTTIVGAVALGFFVWAGDVTRATAANSFTNQDARSALTTTAGLLLLAVPGSITPGPVVTGRSTTVTFQASDTAKAGCDRRPSATVTLAVANGRLTMTRNGPQNNPGPTTPCAYRTSVVSSKVLADGVATGTGFGYAYRKDASGVVSTDATMIGSVDVTLVVADTVGRAQRYTATAVVSGGGA